MVTVLWIVNDNIYFICNFKTQYAKFYTLHFWLVGLNLVNFIFKECLLTTTIIRMNEYQPIWDVSNDIYFVFPNKWLLIFIFLLSKKSNKILSVFQWNVSRTVFLLNMKLIWNVLLLTFDVDLTSPFRLTKVVEYNNNVWDMQYLTSRNELHFFQLRR